MEKESFIVCLGYNCFIKFGYFNIKCGGGIEIYVYVYFFVNEIIFCFFILFDSFVCLL